MKFQKTDQIYRKKRSKISKKYGKHELWSIIDHWPLYCGIANLSRFMSIADAFRSTLNVPGHIAEFGTWKGANLLFLAKLLKIYDSEGNKLVHAFDSFEGLNEFHSKDGKKAETKKGIYQGSYQRLLEMVRLYDLKDDIIIHKGIIERTLPAFVKKNSSIAFSFVYCDTDLYQSTKLILNTLHPLMVKGGVFVLDEWNYDMWPGETLAVKEFLKVFGEFYILEHVLHARQPSILLRKCKD